MKNKRLLRLGLPLLMSATIFMRGGEPLDTGKPSIPKTWNDAEMTELEVPLANPIGSPKHVSAEYYYKIPVRPIFKTYPIYAPGHEPPGYMERLKQGEPMIVWDDKGHAPPLETEQDWIKAGELVFEAPILFTASEGVTALEDVRNPDWYSRVRPPLEKDGVMPFYSYVVRKKGEIELGQLSCATCHTRVMTDGTVIEGAQGNFPFDHANGFEFRKGKLSAEGMRVGIVGAFGMPWLDPPPETPVAQMSVQQMIAMAEAIPAGVLARRHSSMFYPPHIPDLIGVKHRHYLDATGLQQHRSIVDLMRYAAINQGENDLASYNGMIPADEPTFHKLPDPDKVGGRYSDEQLFALALYVYSLQPPPNPNKFDALAARGQKIFEREGCPTCHTPPAYTSNKLTPAIGFKVPNEHWRKYDILPVSVGTDPYLATRTRRGTGYYKVPSLRGVWYRSMFGHNGWCATLEDWLDEKRTHDDYVPTGFKPYDVKTYSVKGHPFGLRLAKDDKQALIAFLKTL